MPSLVVTDTKGQTRTIEAASHLTVMQALRNADFADLLALCGGCLSCATCHVIIDPADFAKLPPIAPDEDDLLGGSDHRAATSRLSCQVPVHLVPDGLRLTIAPEG